MAANPLRMDPTRTTTLRNRFMTQMRMRYNLLKRDITELVVDEDALALKPRVLGLQLNTRWQFLTSDAKVREFQNWFQTQVDRRILSVDNTTGDPWTSTYVHSAYRQGLTRAYIDAHIDDLSEGFDFQRGTQAEFLRSAFAQPEAVSKLKLLGTRTFEQLKGVTAQMGQEMNRILTDGISRGASPRDIAREMHNRIDVSRSRALTIARTEIIHAHAEGQLDGMERLGVEEISAMVEWATAGDPCPLCASLRGVVLTIKKARGLIPRHPNCRCAWVPANVGEDTRGQKRSKTAIDRAILKSVRAEKPKARSPRKESRWAGADLKIARRRRSQRT